VRNAPTPLAAGRWLRQNLRKGDAALVKGSCGVHLERAFEALKRQ
jgi:UDP-N-acetylmuramyl pentapeptide synthase